MKQRIFLQLGLAWGVLLTASLVSAQTTNWPTRNGHTLCQREVVVPLPSPPQPEGTIVKMLNAISQEYGCVFQTPVMHEARIDFLYLAGKVDISFGAGQSAAQDAMGIFVPSVKIPMGFGLLRKPGMPTKAEQIFTDPKVRVLVIRGSGMGDEYEQVVDKLKKTNPVQSVLNASTLKMLIAGHGDAILSESSFESYAKELDKSHEYAFLPIGVSVTWGSYVSTKSTPGFDSEWMAELFYKYEHKFDLLSEWNTSVVDAKLKRTWAEPSGKFAKILQQSNLSTAPKKEAPQ